MQSLDTGNNKMNIRYFLWCVMTSAWVGICACSAHSASGAYVAQGAGFVEMLQITAKPDGNLEGTLTHAELKANGALSQDNAALSGAVDGHAITLVVKSPLPFLQSSSLSGTIDGGIITLTLPSGVVRYSASNAQAYQTAMEQTKAQGASIRQQQQAKEAEAAQQRHIAEENSAVDALNNRLTSYASGVQGPRNAQLFEELRSTHEKALAKARDGLKIQQKYPRGSVNANQVAIQIGQIEIGMRGYDIRWENVPPQGRRHLQELDTAIAKSPCSASAQLSNCASQPEAIKAYQAAKPSVERRLTEIDAILKADRATMAGIVTQANDYAR